MTLIIHHENLPIGAWLNVYHNAVNFCCVDVTLFGCRWWICGGYRWFVFKCSFSKMVFESIVVELVNRFLGDYIENLDTSQLSLSIWGGVSAYSLVTVMMSCCRMNELLLLRMSWCVRILFFVKGSRRLNRTKLPTACCSSHQQK